MYLEHVSVDMARTHGQVGEEMCAYSQPVNHLPAPPSAHPMVISPQYSPSACIGTLGLPLLLPIVT